MPYQLLRLWAALLLLMAGGFSHAIVGAPPDSVAAPPDNSVPVPAAQSTTKPDASTALLARAQLSRQVEQQLQKNNARLAQLEQANQTALARNQELQLSNDNLTVQVQVLQSERSAQMFLYGAATLAVGSMIGFMLAHYLLSKRTRRW